jgi:hypothetical protein
LRLDAAARDALLGYALIDMFTSEYTIKFGTWNQRPVKKNEVRKLLQSMEDFGIRRDDHANFLAIVIHRSNLTGTLSKDAYPQGGLPLLKVSTIPNSSLLVKAASGQHRFHAVKSMWDKLKTELDELQSDNKKKKVQMLLEAKVKRVEEIGVLMRDLRLWGVSVYDEG